jgi:predicted dehydrogenase
MTEEKKKKKLSLAIVGCGQIVTHHLEAIAATEAFQIHALCDPSKDRRSVIRNLPAVRTINNKDYDEDEPSVLEFDTLDDMITSSAASSCTINVIFIAVPHDLHETLAMTALTRTTSSFVVLEKPLAPTLESCNRLVQASMEHGNRLYIAEQSPYWPGVAKAKAMVREGAIGTLVSAAAYYYESMRDNITSGSVEDGGALGWRGSVARAGGGIVMDGGLHWLRPLREVCGKVTKVTGIIRPNLAPSLKMEGEALGHALLEMESTTSSNSNNSNDDDDDCCEYLRQPENSGPLVATYSCNMLATAPMAHDRCPYFRFTGTGGELIILGNGLDKTSPGAGNLIWYHDKGASQGTPVLPTDQTGGFFRGFEGLWRQILTTVQTKDAKAAHESVVRAADDVKVVLALYRSSKSRQWESTDP